MRFLFLSLGVAGAVALSCGARSNLETLREAGSTPIPPDDDDDDGAGASGAGGSSSNQGGGGGSVVAPECENVTITPYAVSELILDGPSIFEIDLARVTGSPTGACAAGVIQEQAPSEIVGTVCFEAFGAWPNSLGDVRPVYGSTNDGVRAASGQAFGMALITGQVGDPFASGSRFGPNVEDGGDERAWVYLPDMVTHRPSFLTRLSDGTFVAGLRAQGNIQYLDVLHLTPAPSTTHQAVACALGDIVADGVELGGRFFVATSTGGAPGCISDDGVPDPPTRIQIIDTTDETLPVIYQRSIEAVVEDVRILPAPNSFWIVWKAGGNVTASRIDPTGQVDVEPVVVAIGGAFGPIDAAMRGDNLLVASIDASDPDLGPDIVITEVALDGEKRAFGGFDSSEYPWTGDLSILVSPDASKILAAHAAGPGMVAARRLDCQPE